ncbi:hypothetical protein ICN24_04050 [Polynucleobacter sp. UK-Kesae-W10]|nr:hypothetical protein [Polynucleobacter sp. UK-Kesae-W10]
MRRGLLALLLPLGLAACIATQPYPQGELVAPPHPTPPIRAPKVGQEWVYQIRNVFNQELVDTVTERVVSVGREVRIARSGAKAGQLPDEIQSPWGFALQDPHWNPPQQFQQAMPLWPEQLTPGWNRFYQTRYEVVGYPSNNYYWALNISANDWERVQVPAGQFLTLKFHNQMPYFESNDLFRIGNIRDEDVWFAPEIGRWAVRRGMGRYITDGVWWANAYWEDYWQWELISWK